MVFIPRWEKYKDKKPTGLVEIDYGHELSKDAFSLTLFNNNYSLVNNIVLTGDTDVIYNNSANFDGSSRLLLTNNPIVGDYFSAVCRFKPNSILKDHAVFDVNSGFTDQELIFWFDTSSSKLRLAAFAGSALYGTTLIDDTSKYYDAALTTDVFAHTGILYLNSKQENQGSIGARDFREEFVALGANYTTSGKESDGQYEYIYLYNKQLSADEITSLHENPYQILKPRKTFFVLTQSSGVTASVTGASVSLSAGTLSASITEQLTGAGLMATAGSSVSAIDHSLSGESIALAQGLVQGIIEALLTGQTLTGQSGLLQSAINQALTGQLISAEADTVTSTAAYSLTGQPISSDLDNITNAIDQALTGQSATTNISALSEAIAHSLTGQSINMVAGFVELIGNVVRGLTGEPLSVAQTTLTYDLTQNLLGGSVTTSSGVVEVSVNQGLTGSVIALSIGDLALQGQTARQLVGALISATSGSVQSAIEASLSGQAIALTQATIESAVSSLLTGQTITIEQGSSSVTLEKTLAGETIISGQGTIVFDSLDKSATLTGLQIQTSAGIVLVDGVRDTRLVNVIAMGNGGYVVVLDASTKVIIQDNGNKVIN